MAEPGSKGHPTSEGIPSIDTAAVLVQVLYETCPGWARRRQLEVFRTSWHQELHPRPEGAGKRWFSCKHQHY